MESPSDQASEGASTQGSPPTAAVAACPGFRASHSRFKTWNNTGIHVLLVLDLDPKLLMSVAGICFSWPVNLYN